MQHEPEAPTAGDTDTMTENALTLGVRPVWQILDEARESRFTGEVVFQLAAPVVAYFDAGVVYVAERMDEPPLADRLVDAGVVNSDDLRRGAVRVGRVEHLGRLFERLPDLDRDAVIVRLELDTETLISELANGQRCDIRFTAYRHHPAGVHRWYAGPPAFTAHGEFAPVAGADRSAIEDLAGLPLAPDGSTGQLYIEWDEPILGLDDSGLEQGTVHFSDQELAPDLREPHHVVEDWTGQVDVVDELVLFDDPQLDGEPVGDDHANGLSEDVDRVDDDFDGLDDLAGAVDVLVESDADDAGAWTKLPMPDPHQRVSTQPPVVETDGVNFRIELPFTPDEVDDDAPASPGPSSDAVADAVRRALTAIEQATIEWDDVSADSAPETTSASNGGRSVEEAPSDDQQLPPRWDDQPDGACGEQVVAPIAEGSPFAPPTLDMSAEAIYARSEEAADPDERASALRRLIGGLRKK